MLLNQSFLIECSPSFLCQLTVLDSGDRIRRMDGIMSVSMSFIMYRLSPPPRGNACFDFDESFTKGVFRADSHSNEACLFSEAIKEAVSMGLMEEDIAMDLNNNVTGKKLWHWHAERCRIMGYGMNPDSLSCLDDMPL